MLSNETLISEAARFKTNAKSRFDKALAALLALAWKYQHLGSDFSFDADRELYSRALEICREMSDGCMADAQDHIRNMFGEEFEMGDAYGRDALERMDMAGSHLLELLNIWVALAFANGYTQAYTRISIGRYMNNPFASGMFGAWGRDVLKWGRGYDKNLINRLAVIGQNLIIDETRRMEWMDEKAKGAKYYIRRRGSGYDCDICDENCGFPIPISVPYERIHSRCVCWPEYHDEDNPFNPTKEILDESRKKTIEYGKENLLGRTFSMPGIEKPVTFTMKGIKESANQPHKHFVEKNDAVRDIIEIAPNSTYVGGREDDKKRHYYYRYYKTTISGDDSFIVIRENKDTGLIDFYSIVDAMKKE